MAYNITNVKADLEGVLHGSTINQIQNFYGVCNRAARQVLQDCDPQETKRISPFASPIYSEVYDYALPVDLKGNKVIDIRPQVNRTLRDIYLQQYNQAFDVGKPLQFFDSFTINFNSSLKTIRINSPFLQVGTLINEASGVTTNGTWSGGGTATSLETDNINFVGFGGSLAFNLGAGANPSTGYVENSTMEPQDLSALVNQGTLFLYTYLPTATDCTSVQLRFGSSATDYYSISTSVTQQNTVFQNGWNLLAYEWASATTTGTPDPSAISYVRVTYTYNGTLQTAVRLNDIACKLGTILEIEYYSKYLFRDSVTGAFQEAVTSDSNLVNLDVDSYNLFFYQVAMLASQQQQGLNALQFDGKFFADKYKEALQRYMSEYKSEIQKPRALYYKKPNPNYLNWANPRRY